MDAAILAGGRARRFGGRDKGALHVGRMSIFDRQLAALRGVADRVLVVTGGDPTPYQDRGIEVVADLLPNAGALGGIYTALAAASSEHVLVLACDLPFLTASFLARLTGMASDRHDAVVPRSRDGLQPLCAVYGRRLMLPIRQQVDAGKLKVADVLALARLREVGPDVLEECDPQGRLFFNVNSPAELEKANGLAARDGL